MTEIKTERFLELERLASQFIIGYQPLTDKQKSLITIRDKLRDELNLQRSIVRRIDRVIYAIEQELAKTQR